jgi:hypothetical protein
MEAMKVIQEERLIFWEVTVSVTARKKKVNMNTSLILNG